MQEYIVSIDDWHKNIITSEYREKYFGKTMLDLSKQGRMFLAVEQNKCLGLICGKVIEYVEFDKYYYTCPKSAEITEFIISKNLRYSGVGCALIEHIENYFKSLCCEYCNLDVFEPNILAKSF